MAASTSARLGSVACRVLDTADSILRLASRLLGSVFRLDLAVALDLADGFLDGALGLLCAACNPILIHDRLWVWKLCT
jgi:hypothetical protein